MISVRAISTLMLFLLASTFWVGQAFFQYLRVSDFIAVIALLIFLFSGTIKFKLKSSGFFIFSIFMCYFAISSVVNLLVGYLPTLTGFFLVLKLTLHAFLAFFLYVEVSRLPIIDAKRLLFMLLIIFILLCLWSVFHIMTYDYFYSGMCKPNLRPSFPFVKETCLSDAHLLSAYFAVSYIFFIEHIPKFFKKPACISLLVSFIAILGVLSTGSRTPLIIIPMWIFIRFFRSTNLIFVLLALTFCSIIFYLLELMPETFSYYLDRIFHVDLMEDASLAKRFSRFINEFNGLEIYYYMFGKTFLFAEAFYFDSSATFFLSNFGLPGLVLFFFLVLFFIMKAFLSNRLDYLLIAVFLISLVASEYFLISRYFIPCIFYVCLSRYFNFKNYKMIGVASSSEIITLSKINPSLHKIQLKL